MLAVVEYVVVLLVLQNAADNNMLTHFTSDDRYVTIVTGFISGSFLKY